MARHCPTGGVVQEREQGPSSEDGQHFHWIFLHGESRNRHWVSRDSVRFLPCWSFDRDIYTRRCLVHQLEYCHLGTRGHGQGTGM